MDPVLLKTDVLFFVLLGTALAYIVYARRYQHLCAPWRQVARQPLGMAAAVILCSYLLVAILDSIHFRAALPASGAGGAVYSRDLTSVFDVLVSPLRANVERTYSAPFAAEAYAKEVVELADGSNARAYPRLEHGGAHLRDPASERGADIAARLIGGFALGSVLTLIVGAMAVTTCARSSGQVWSAAALSMLRGDGAVPWRTIVGTRPRSRSRMASGGLAADFLMSRLHR